jgi:predicted ester cyclase
LVTTYKTYHGTHHGTFLGLAPTGRRIHFETVDVMRVCDATCFHLDAITTIKAVTSPRDAREPFPHRVTTQTP